MNHDTLAATLAVIVALAIALLAAMAGAGLFDARQEASDPACAEWTDGCVICARRPEGLACSTPGIACTRGRIQCLRR